MKKLNSRQTIRTRGVVRSGCISWYSSYKGTDMHKIKIGIIGGTGLDNPDLLTNRKESQITTRFGKPSSEIVIEGDIQGVPCVLIPRHGKDHSVPPSKINFRANIWALKELGCTHVIATMATGSLKEEIKPGDLVIPHDFLDRTYNRKQTFYDGEEGSLKGVFHLPMHPPFCEGLRQTIIETTKELGIHCHESGSVVVIEGPRFSSKAEAKMYQMFGCDLVNMTAVPELVLAKEAGLLYASIALATDYDCWREGHEPVSHTFVVDMFKKNVDKVVKLIVAVVENVSKKNWDKEIAELRHMPGIINDIYGIAGTILRHGPACKYLIKTLMIRAQCVNLLEPGRKLLYSK